jgi:hypothetical protein
MNFCCAMAPGTWVKSVVANAAASGTKAKRMVVSLTAQVVKNKVSHWA